MNGTFPEKDWKYLRTIHDEMLAALCGRINAESAAILAATDMSEYEKYLKLFRHLHDSDDIVAACFNDWRRSRIGTVIINLRRQGLLTDEHAARFTDETRDFIKRVESL